MRILVADDDPVIRHILQAGLQRDGHEVVAVGDGQAAWEAVQQQPCRLVITDWVMPGLDGLELVYRIRTAGFPWYTYIILLTARSDKADVVIGLEAGADDYLSKPFNPAELRARVNIGLRILDLEDRLSQARDQLAVLAAHDSLTGLLNRRSIREYAEAALLQAVRAGAAISVILLDLDHFKDVNDRYGHQTGDDALRLVAETIAAALRTGDRVGRMGGEEFLVVLPDTALDQAVAVAERIRRRVAARPLTLPDGTRVPLRVSAGVATAPPVAPTLDVLLQQADAALYRAKRGGRNQVCAAAAQESPAPTADAERHTA